MCGRSAVIVVLLQAFHGTAHILYQEDHHRHLHRFGNVLLKHLEQRVPDSGTWGKATGGEVVQSPSTSSPNLPHLPSSPSWPTP